MLALSQGGFANVKENLGELEIERRIERRIRNRKKIICRLYILHWGERVHISLKHKKGNDCDDAICVDN